jgi:hypothetical protein
MSGCAVCVYDLYEEALQAYKTNVGRIRTSLQAMGVPRSEWPPQLELTGEVNGGKELKPSVVVSAFEEMERALKAKREAEAAMQR